MCGYHWYLQRTDTYDELARVDVAGGRGVDPESRDRGRVSITHLAHLHALAEPASASLLQVVFSDCSGEAVDATGLADVASVSDPSPQDLAREVLGLRHALQEYARPGFYALQVREDDDGLDLRAPALLDRGARARQALEGRG